MTLRNQSARSPITFPLTIASNTFKYLMEDTESPSKKRRSSVDLEAEEMATAPSRKMAKLDGLEEVSQELVAPDTQASPVKKPSRSVREAKKLHKERVRAFATWNKNSATVCLLSAFFRLSTH